MWEGSVSWNYNLLAAPVKLGGSLVPRKVTMLGKGSNGHPDIRLEFEIDPYGLPRCSGTHVQSKPDGRGVTSADLAAFDLSALTREAFASMASPIVRESGGETVAVIRDLSEREATSVINALWKAEVTGGTAHRLAELARVSEVYLAAPGAPVETVSVTLGYTKRTAFRRVAEARDEGLLPERGEPDTEAHAERRRAAIPEPPPPRRLYTREELGERFKWDAQPIEPRRDDGGEARDE